MTQATLSSVLLSPNSTLFCASNPHATAHSRSCLVYGSILPCICRANFGTLGVLEAAGLEFAWLERPSVLLLVSGLHLSLRPLRPLLRGYICSRHRRSACYASAPFQAPAILG